MINFCVGEHTHFFYPSLEDFVWLCELLWGFGPVTIEAKSYSESKSENCQGRRKLHVDSKLDIIQESNGS